MEKRHATADGSWTRAYRAAAYQMHMQLQPSQQDSQTDRQTTALLYDPYQQLTADLFQLSSHKLAYPQFFQ